MPAAAKNRRVEPATTDLKHLRVMLDPEDHAAFRILAAQAGESMYVHAIRVIRDYVRNAKKR